MEDVVEHLYNVVQQIKKEMAEKKVNLGNSGMTALWNLHPDNLDACRAKDRLLAQLGKLF